MVEKIDIFDGDMCQTALGRKKRRETSCEAAIKAEQEKEADVVAYMDEMQNQDFKYGEPRE